MNKRAFRREMSRLRSDLEKQFSTLKGLNDEQNEYIQAVYDSDIVIGLGKAGTGKSYCAAGLASEHLNKGLVEKIIICRSSVQADEIGFLTGDAIEKTMPYVTQVLVDMAEFINVRREISNNRIEILSLAFARGRSFRNSFVILEEAQNCTLTQLKMFVTRIGEGSKLVISGDVTQTDLNYRHMDDFSKFVGGMSKIASPENKIAIVELINSVRHPMIEKILSALEGIS